jgi:hypothetical protein
MATKTVGTKLASVRTKLPLFVHVSFLFTQNGAPKEVQVFFGSDIRWQDFTSSPSFAPDRWMATKAGPMVLAAYLGD